MFRSVRQLVRRELGEWRRLADVRELAKLDDHQLADIGLRRDQLFMLVFDREPPQYLTQKPGPEPAYRPSFEPCG